MNTKKRTIYDLSVDDATASDIIKNAELSSAEVVYPFPENQVPIKLKLENETLNSASELLI